MLGQGVTAQLPGENRSGALELQLLQHRAVTHQHQACARLACLYRFECVQQQVQIFFFGKAPHTQHGQILRGQPPLLAQGITAVCRVVSDRIDAAADHFEPLKTNRGQRRAQGFCRHHGAACMVVEFFEISHDGLV